MKHLVQVVVAGLAAGSALICAAQEGIRAHRWEFTLQPQYVESWSNNGKNGSDAKVDSSWGFGLGLAYNLNDNFSIGGEFSWSHPDFRATITPGVGNSSGPHTVDGTLYISTLRLNATWNLLKRPLTPFVSVAAGGTYIDTDVPDGPPSNQCWWWGWYYYCGTYYPTKSDTYFSYAGSVGLRWDSQGSFFVRGLVGRQWIDIGGDAGTPGFTAYRVDIGFKF
jgi:hypothetical protein